MGWFNTAVKVVEENPGISFEEFKKKLMEGGITDERWIQGAYYLITEVYGFGKKA